jgi:glucan biosynthesis protein C
MGFFFFLSGCFTPGSYDRKGPGRFLRDRLIRLGIPTIAFMFVLGPIASIGIWQMPSSLTGITTPLTWQNYPGLIGIGPLWFALMLLVFDLGYAALRLAARRPAAQPESPATAPRYWAIGIFILVLALVSFLIRIVWPLGKYVLSGGTWQSAVYALWDSTFSVGICMALIVFFRRFFNRPGQLGGFLSSHAFIVYIIHPPILVFLAVALRDLQLQHLLKFGLLAIIAVPACFAVAFLVHKIPLAARVV